MNVSVISCEDSKELIQGLVKINPAFGQARVYADVFQLLKGRHQLQLVIFELTTGLDQMETQLQLLMESKPSAEVIVLADQIADDEILFLLRRGIAAVVEKGDNWPVELSRALNAVLQGCAYYSPIYAHWIRSYFKKSYEADNRLTARERDVVKGLLGGLSYKLIADRHQISLETVRMHIRNIYKKFGVNSKSELFSIFKS